MDFTVDSGALCAYESMVSDWFEIIVVTPAESDGDVGALLSQEIPAAGSGTELREDGVVFWVRAEEVEPVLADTRRVAAALAESGFAIGEVRAQPALPEEEWREAWKKHFHITHITPRLVIVPSWESYANPRPDELLLHLDPGQAFGTGAHSTTRMVLAAIDEAAGRGFAVSNFLDVGTGSGILSIAAARLWPHARGRGLDTDPIAVAAARENCAKNGVADRIQVNERHLEDVTGDFDLIMANIQADVLADLSPAIHARLAPGGMLLLSGLLTHQVDEVAALYSAPTDMALQSVTSASDDSGFCSACLLRITEGS